MRAITDASGAVVVRHDYQPFGVEWASQSATGESSVRFAGKERDPETGTSAWGARDYSGARFVQSQLGRFTSVDPGHVGGNLFDPKSWSGYVYARNSPLQFVDPSGTDYYYNVVGGQPFTTSDDMFERFRADPVWAGVTFSGSTMWGGIYAGERQVGTYRWFDPRPFTRPQLFPHPRLP